MDRDTTYRDPVTGKKEGRDWLTGEPTGTKKKTYRVLMGKYGAVLRKQQIVLLSMYNLRNDV
jgi:hypothetical protein